MRWSFAARDFVLDATKTGLTDERGIPLDWRSREGWTACEPCKRLIMATDRDGLAARSARRWHRKHPGSDHMYGETLRAVRLAHDGFWANRTDAEPVPVGPGDVTDPTRSVSAINVYTYHQSNDELLREIAVCVTPADALAAIVAHEHQVAPPLGSVWMDEGWCTLWADALNALRPGDTRSNVPAGARGWRYRIVCA